MTSADQGTSRAQPTMTAAVTDAIVSGMPKRTNIVAD
jgi:hypothetical protein